MKKKKTENGSKKNIKKGTINQKNRNFKTSKNLLKNHLNNKKKETREISL
jgi:hypothetical protein